MLLKKKYMQNENQKQILSIYILMLTLNALIHKK